MKQFIKRVLLFTVLIYLTSYVLSLGYDCFFKKFPTTYNKEQWVLNKKNENYDYVVSGSSRAFNTINICLIDSTILSKGINLATSGSSFADNYLLLYTFLKTNRVKAVLLTFDEYTFNSSESYSYPFKDYEYLPRFFEDTVREIYKDNISANKYSLYSYVPLARYSEFSSKYNPFISLINYNNRSLLGFDQSKGSSLLQPVNYSNKYDSIPLQKVRVNSNDLKYFNQIIKLCDSKGIKLILLTAPICYSNIADPRIVANHEILRDIAQKNQLPRIDFLEIDNIRQPQYFNDINHVNLYGANLFSGFVSHKLDSLLNNEHHVRHTWSN